MANQPKKYKKFVATAATATLVASAIVPVASAKSFNDVADNNDHKANIDKISDLGYMGTGDNFNPAGNLTRGQVAIILANWAKDAAGKEVPADYKTAQRFEDVELTADDKLLQSAALVFDNEIFSGSNGNLLPANEINRLQMALVLNKAYKAVKGIDLVELAGDTSDVVIGDLDKIPAEHQGVVKALKKLNITAPANFNPNGKVTRGQFATFFIKTIEAEGADVQVNSVTAVGAKKLEVKFNSAVDTTKANISIKKGSVKVNVESISWNEAKTIATVNLSGKITQGEYTANVSGLTEETLTATVKTENERVESIAIPNNQAPIITAAGGSRSVKLGYVVYNQYGEDVTKSLGNVTATASGAGVGTASLTAGTVTVPLTASTADIGSKFVLTLVETTTGKSVSETITLSAAAVASSFEFNGVYNKDGKQLNELTTISASNQYFILVDVKDQYGNLLDATELNAANIIINNVNPTVATVDSTGSTPNTAVFSTVEVDGENKTAIEVKSVLKAGETNVMLVSGATGANKSFNLTVAEAQRANKLEFETPELFVAGETTFVPITVYDKTGEQIKDIDVIKDAARGVTVSDPTGALTITKNKDGVIGVNVTTSASAQNVTLTGSVVPTLQPVVKTFTVSAAAKPVRVEGLSSSATTALLKKAGRTDTQAINLSTVVIYDQYERALTNAQKTALFTSNYELIATEATTAATSAIALTGSASSYTVTAQAKGTEKVTLSIKDVAANATVSGSEKVVTFTTVDGTEYVSYEVEEIGLVPDKSVHNLQAGSEALSSDYDQAVVVYGVLADGSKVKLDAADYTVAFSDSDVSVDATTGVIKVADAGAGSAPKVNYDANNDGTVAASELTAQVKLTVTIHATGTQLTKDVVISRDGANPVSVVAIADGSYTTGTPAAVPATGTVVSASNAAKLTGLKSVEITSTSATVNSLVDFLVTDQYGVITFSEGTTATYLATPAVPYSLEFAGQTTAGLVISAIDSKDSATVTATIAPGVTYTFTVVGK